MKNLGRGDAEVLCAEDIFVIYLKIRREACFIQEVYMIEREIRPQIIFIWWKVTAGMKE